MVSVSGSRTTSRRNSSSAAYGNGLVLETIKSECDTRMTRMSGSSAEGDVIDFVPASRRHSAPDLGGVLLSDSDSRYSDDSDGELPPPENVKLVASDFQAELASRLRTLEPESPTCEPRFFDNTPEGTWQEDDQEPLVTFNLPAELSTDLPPVMEAAPSPPLMQNNYTCIPNNNMVGTLQANGFRTPNGFMTPGLGSTSGMMTPGLGGTPGMLTPGLGGTSGMMNSGVGGTSGMMTPGLATPGMMTPGLATPGMMTPGLATPGMMTPGLATSGMTDHPWLCTTGTRTPGMMNSGIIGGTRPGMMGLATPVPGLMNSGIASGISSGTTTPLPTGARSALKVGDMPQQNRVPQVQNSCFATPAGSPRSQLQAAMTHLNQLQEQGRRQRTFQQVINQHNVTTPSQGISLASCKEEPPLQPLSGVASGTTTPAVGANINTSAFASALSAALAQVGLTLPGVVSASQQMATGAASGLPASGLPASGLPSAMPSATPSASASPTNGGRPMSDPQTPMGHIFSGPNTPMNPTCQGWMAPDGSWQMMPPMPGHPMPENNGWDSCGGPEAWNSWAWMQQAYYWQNYGGWDYGGYPMSRFGGPPTKEDVKKATARAFYLRRKMKKAGTTEPSIPEIQ